MKKLSVTEIVGATKGRLIKGAGEVYVEGISTDTRILMPNEAFFALIGENFDGHDMLSNLDSTKCKLIVVSKENCVAEHFDAAVILVDDTLRAYQDLARYYKRIINPITIAITGSVGKTSLKDMVCHIASKKYSTVATVGNYNNHVGVPKTIFDIEEDTEVLVLEMGMDHKDEIRRLVEIAEPTIAAITNIGISHRENFDSDDGIFNAKMEIASLFGSKNYLVINGDDEKLIKLKKTGDITYSIVSVGTTGVCDYVVSKTRYSENGNLEFSVLNKDEKVKYSIPVAGSYSGITAGMATALLSILGIEMAFSAEALADIKRTPHRLQLIKMDEMTIIDDVYNASPDSMKSALEYLIQIPGGRKIAVLAGMNELGDDSASLHRQTGAAAVELGVDILINVGSKARDISEGAVRALSKTKKNANGGNETKVLSFRNNSDASAYLNLHKEKDDIYLVKGSRGMKMEEIVNALSGEIND